MTNSTKNLNLQDSGSNIITVIMDFPSKTSRETEKNTTNMKMILILTLIMIMITIIIKGMRACDVASKSQHNIVYFQPSYSTLLAVAVLDMQ